MIGLARQTALRRVSIIGRKRSADVLRPLTAEHKPCVVALDMSRVPPMSSARRSPRSWRASSA